MRTITPAIGLRWFIVVVVAITALASMILSEVANLPHLYAWLILAICVALAPWG